MAAPSKKKEKVHKAAGVSVTYLDDDPCRACGKLMSAVSGGRVVINNSSWHKTCWKCKTCGGALPNDKDQETLDVLCKSCFLKKYDEKCTKCGKTIQVNSTLIRAYNKQFHRECFTCTKCSQPIAEDEFIDIEGKPYHDQCST